MVREPDITRSALVIVDMQNDCIHPEGYFGWVSRQPGYEDRELAPKGLVSNVKRLAESVRKAGRPVVYLQVLFEPDYSDACITYWKKPFWKEKGCYIRDTWGAQIIDELTPQPGDTVVTKKGYSGFQTAPLDEVLRNDGINTCVMTGVGSGACVESTIRQGVELGYCMILVSDGSGGWSLESHQNTVQRLDGGFADAKTTDEVIQMLETAIKVKVQ